MAIETEKSEIKEIEEQALEHLAEEGVLPAELLEEEEVAERIPRLRYSIAVAFAIFAASVMVGGVFRGPYAYFWSSLAGLLGIVLANAVVRIRRPTLVMLSGFVGVFVIGLVIVAGSGNLQDVFNVYARAAEASKSGDTLRPPVEFTAGWRAITGWLMGAIGFGAAWVALEIRRSALAILLPLPLVAIGAISVPKSAQLASGLVAVALFAMGLGVLSGTQLAGGGERLSLAFELRRAAKGLPLVAGIIVALFFMERVNFLFPDPIFDPTQEAQAPKTIPLSDVEDRVLFTVESQISGPWRMGLLDVYDGQQWKLPPFAETRLREVPRTGIVDSNLVSAEQATFEIKDLGGAILPGLPNSTGIVAEGPRLAYDRRTGNIRMAAGQVEPGLRYTVVAARIPSVAELQQVHPPFPQEVERFLLVPEPPPAVELLLNRAPTSSPWDRFDAVRQQFLKRVVAQGQGTPVPVPPSKVNDMIGGSQRGTPFEIVAGQALLARWSGVPARIGYGFDGGDRVEDILEVRPKHGAAFLEVYFTGYGWLPVLGTPLQAAAALGSAPQQRAEGILPSDEISVPLLVAIQVDPRSYLFDQVRAVLSVLLPVVTAILFVYYTWPALRKWRRRRLKRAWANHEGPTARIAVWYAEFRDLATDFGYRYPADTPLMFLDRITEDEEHTELAWLVTRTLWGDLQDQAGEPDALAAEELSRSLMKRLRQAHSWTLRVVALVSRMSIKYPYARRLGAKIEKKGVTRKAA